MTALEELGGLLAELKFPPLTAPARPHLRRHILDTIGAWIAGARTGEGRALRHYHRGPKDAGKKAKGAPLASELMTACALARLSELDDIHLASMTTPGSIVIPAALTIAGSLPVVAEGRLTAAITAGYEAMVRLGAAIDGPSVLYRGIWPTYFAAPFGVAAVAASLLDLDERQTAHALALALTLASPGVGHHNAATTARWFALGHAAARGLEAARAAQSGFTADLALLDGAFLSGIYRIVVERDILTAGFRHKLALEEVSVKPWCAARQTMAATQAFKEIVHTGVDLHAIDAITAFVLPPHLAMVDHGIVAGDRASYLTSVKFQMARAVLAPDAVLDPSQSCAPHAADIQALMGKITVKGDEALLPSYPKAWPGRAVVLTYSGRHEQIVQHVPGDPERPIDVLEKFRRVVSPVLGSDGVEALQGEALALIDDQESLAPLLVAVAHACAAADAMR